MHKVHVAIELKGPMQCLGSIPEQNRGLLTKVERVGYWREVNSVCRDVIAILAIP